MLSLIVGGVLMLPSALFLVVSYAVVSILSLPGLFFLCYSKPKVSSSQQRQQQRQRRRAIITGGSSGIGLSVAEECVKRGEFFHEIILIARNVDRLNKAKAKIEEIIQDSKTKKNIVVQTFSVDISNDKDLKTAAKAIFGKDKEQEDPTATYLFCIAGSAHPEYFEKIPASVFYNQVQTNQLGTIYTVQAFLEYMTSGTIVLTSSMAGQCGTFGYTAYSPTKFALRGFAEVLQIELVRRPISVCLAFPPDTDTPGFQEENKTKPLETKLISEVQGLAKPADIAQVMVKEAIKENPNFFIYFSFDGWMLSCLTAGFAPVTSLSEAISQVAGMSLFRLVSLFYLKSWTTTIRNSKAPQENKPIVVARLDTKTESSAST